MQCAPIKVLDVTSRSLIHATSIITLPVHAMQELIENSIDAGASSISIETDALTGGLRRFSVMDNGHGIVNWHNQLGVLNNISLRGVHPLEDRHLPISYGYRGTALFAIARTVGSPVGNMLVTSKRNGDRFATLWQVGSFETSHNDRCLYSHPHGTSVCVENMFETTYPVRFSYLRTQVSKLISDTEKLVMAYCFARPDIKFRVNFVKQDGRGKIIATNPKMKTFSSIVKSFAGHPCIDCWEFSEKNDKGFEVKVAVASFPEKYPSRVQLLILNNKPTKDACRFYQSLRKSIFAAGFGGKTWVVSVTTFAPDLCNLDAWRRGDAVFRDGKFESTLLLFIISIFERSREAEASLESPARKMGRSQGSSTSYGHDTSKIRGKHGHSVLSNIGSTKDFKENISANTSADILTHSLRKQGASTANTTCEGEPDRNSQMVPAQVLPQKRARGVHAGMTKSRMKPTRTKCPQMPHAPNRDSLCELSTNSFSPLQKRRLETPKCHPQTPRPGTEYSDYFEETSIPVHHERRILSSRFIEPGVSHAAVKGNSSSGILSFFDAGEIIIEPGQHGVPLVKFKDREPYLNPSQAAR